MTSTLPSIPIGPLTTVFTAPSNCFVSDTEWLTCFPSGFTKPENNFYSPGICPSGYTSACNRYQPEGQGPSAAPDETIAICCRSFYTCDSGWTSYCQFSSRLYPLIQVRWRATDLTILETDPTRPGVRPTPTSSSTPTLSTTPTRTTPTTPPTASSTIKPSQSNKKGGLSVGAKAAIGVLIPLLVIGLGVLALFLFRRRKARQSSAPEMEIDDVRAGGNMQSAQDTGNLVQEEKVPDELPKHHSFGQWANNTTTSLSAAPSPQSPVPMYGPPDPKMHEMPAVVPAEIEGVQSQVGSFGPATSHYEIYGGTAGVAPTAAYRALNPSSPLAETEHRASSGPSIFQAGSVLSPNEDEDLRQLKIQEQRIREQKERLQMIANLEQEEMRLQQQIRDREAQNSRS